MNWMDKLERKWGRHAVANLSRYFVLAQVIGYVVQLTAPGLMSYMNFDMEQYSARTDLESCDMDFYTDGIAGCFWNLISVLCAYVGQFAGIHAWNIPHECIFVGKCDFV